MTTTMAPTSGNATAREQIDDALRWYCRGIDRLDGSAVARAFHPGALLIDYGPQPMTIETFVTHAMASLGARFTATQHRVSNTLVAFADDGRHALVETYVLATHVQPPDEAAGTGERLHTFAGRYIDDFRELDGSWRIMQRTLRNDWSTVEPIAERMRGTWPASGRGSTPDPLVG